MISLIITTFVILLANYFFPEAVVTRSFWSALFAAIFIGVFNMFLKPLLVLITFPLTLLILGLFLVVINTVIILLTAYILPGFSLAGFWSALFLSLAISFFRELIEK